MATSSTNASASTNAITSGVTPASRCGEVDVPGVVAGELRAWPPGSAGAVSRLQVLAQRLDGVAGRCVRLRSASGSRPAPCRRRARHATLTGAAAAGERACPRGRARRSARASGRPCQAVSARPPARRSAGRPGRRARSRARRPARGVLGGQVGSPGLAVRIDSTGAARAASAPARAASAAAADAGDRAGDPRPTSAPGRPRGAAARAGATARPRSTRSPSSASTAGSTVTDPSTAIATTRIAPRAIEVNTPKPVNSSPASPITTVAPATTIARPTVAAVASSAACGPRPARRSARSRRM